MKPDLVLELLNGASAILDFIFLALLGLYLIKETRRRGIPLRGWIFNLPPSMHFAVAVSICDAGILVRTTTIWLWRAIEGANEFSIPMLGSLTIGGFLIVLGSLCKIRSITRPDYGDAPWLIALYAVIIFVLISLILR